MSRDIRPLEAAITALREQLEHANGRADRAEQRADAERTRADRAEQAIAGERARADGLRELLEAVRAEASEAKQQAKETQQTVEVLRRDLEAAQIAQAGAEADVAELRQADAERKARGRWARLRAAWRGE